MTSQIARLPNGIAHDRQTDPFGVEALECLHQCRHLRLRTAQSFAQGHGNIARFRPDR